MTGALLLKCLTPPSPSPASPPPPPPPPRSQGSHSPLPVYGESFASGFAALLRKWQWKVFQGHIFFVICVEEEERRSFFASGGGTAPCRSSSWPGTGARRKRSKRISGSSLAFAYFFLLSRIVLPSAQKRTSITSPNEEKNTQKGKF